jgi:hypothetical protein
VFRQDALEMAVSVFGSDNVMYGSDYPHTIGDPIGCLARVDAWRTTFGSGCVGRTLGGCLTFSLPK